MNRWFRLYNEIIDDPKILMLPVALRWTWIAMLCISSKNDGQLPSVDVVAVSLRVTRPKAVEYIRKLVDAGLIDDEDGKFSPHNWNVRQYKSDVSTERVKRFRETKRNVSSTVSETPPESETDSETEAETKKQKARAGLKNDDWPDDYQNRFWERYPNKVGKPDALKKLDNSRKNGAHWTDVIVGLENYIRDKPPDRPWCNPATWIDQRRWEDQPATLDKTDGKRTINSPTTGHDAVLAVATRKARELDQRDEVAGTADKAEPSIGLGDHFGGSDGNSGTAR